MIARIVLGRVVAAFVLTGLLVALLPPAWADEAAAAAGDCAACDARHQRLAMPTAVALDAEALAIATLPSPQNLPRQTAEDRPATGATFAANCPEDRPQCAGPDDPDQAPEKSRGND